MVTFLLIDSYTAVEIRRVLTLGKGVLCKSAVSRWCKRLKDRDWSAEGNELLGPEGREHTDAIRKAFRKSSSISQELHSTRNALQNYNLNAETEWAIDPFWHQASWKCVWLFSTYNLRNFSQRKPRLGSFETRHVLIFAVSWRGIRRENIVALSSSMAVSGIFEYNEIVVFTINIVDVCYEVLARTGTGGRAGGSRIS